MHLWCASVFVFAILAMLAQDANGQPVLRNYPYVEMEGTVEEFHFSNWRAYYWRQDFTLLVRDVAGKVHRVISREPTPWAGYRLGTTYAGLAVDWPKQPRVQIVGVRAIDRQPAEFYDLKLDPDKTVTAFILRVKDQEKWRLLRQQLVPPVGRGNRQEDSQALRQRFAALHRLWIFGRIAAPFDSEGKKLLAKYPDSSIYHGRIVSAKNEIGYELPRPAPLGPRQEDGEVRNLPWQSA